MKKRILIMLVMLIAVLSGCGQKETNNQVSEQAINEVRELDYDLIIDSFVPDSFNMIELTIGDIHGPQARIWLESGGGSVYTSDESVVTITELGKVTAVGEGTAYVVIGGDENAMHEIYCYNVYAPAPEADLSNVPQVPGVDFMNEILNFAEDALNTRYMKIGDMDSANASLWADNGACYSSDEDVVTVANNGTVTVVGKGTAYIIVVAPIGGMYEVTKYVING